MADICFKIVTGEEKITSQLLSWLSQQQPFQQLLSLQQLLQQQPSLQLLPLLLSLLPPVTKGTMFIYSQVQLVTSV